MPVITAGGMRYQQSWDDIPADKIKAEEQERITSCIHRALELGINHIETARGYGSSEVQLKRVFKDIPREKYILQSKVAPQEDPKKFEEILENTFDRLGCEYLDLFGFHGINLDKILDWTVRKGGCMEVARRWQKDGRIKHIGFSTHAPCDVIVRAAETGEFDYVNLHWYFINQTNWAAVEAATKQDMGVFIISPNDKGGQLFNPPQKLVDLCDPLTPMGFNTLFCLRRPEVHTLSVGVAQPDQFDPQIDALEHYDNIDATIAPIEQRINDAIAAELGADWWPSYVEGLPSYLDAPGEVNLQYILRLWTLAKGLDMDGYGKYRYGMLGNGDHWMGGQKATDFKDEDVINAVNGHPFAEKIPGILREAHEMFKGEERKRLSSA
ncbi:aldo/keto reductase [Cerasicoccus frondis]|uniref:aldo/keto reductase n=1 Tax=Cerasicoccus frondis TaxID=490090 RepID=UPI00285279E3|nr:aldo/keto reductase [Cerasicoccus frondis]